MHAASVHPEPGSNSRKIYIISRPRSSYNLSSYFILASFTLLSIYNSIDEICTCFFCFVLISCCSIFNDRLLSFFATALLVYHNTLALSIPFWKFFRFFLTFFFLFSSPSSEHLLILPLSPHFVKHFFHLFSHFLHFCIL